jgi:hypothetical protein
MKNCRECSEVLKNKVDFCPNCGEFNQSEIVGNETNKLELFSLLTIFVSAICVVGGLVFFLFFSKEVSYVFGLGIVLINVIMFVGALLIFDNKKIRV